MKQLIKKLILKIKLKKIRKKTVQDMNFKVGQEVGA